MNWESAGVTFDVTQTSIEYEPGVGGKNKMEGMVTGVNSLIFAQEGDATRMTIAFDYDLPGGALGKVVDRLVVERMNSQNLKQSLENLKTLAES